MAGVAVFSGTFVDPVDMAGRTGQCRCFPVRGKAVGVIDGSLGPIGGIVAGSAISAIGAVMGIFTLMAGIAVCAVPLYTPFT